MEEKIPPGDPVGIFPRRRVNKIPPWWSPKKLDLQFWLNNFLYGVC